MRIKTCLFNKIAYICSLNILFVRKLEKLLSKINNIVNKFLKQKNGKVSKIYRCRL
jgi:hypothetical protein